MDEIIKIKKFGELNLNDPFFGSLKEVYKEFGDWFNRKSSEYAFVTYKGSEEEILGFLYVKIELGPVTDIDPPLNSTKTLKVGTFKINPHQTKLGDRYMKKIFDVALTNGIKNIYVTIFSKHGDLIALFEKYGFEKYGKKITGNGTELVYYKSLDRLTGCQLSDYPLMDLRNNRTWLLAIYPKWHTRLFPDSILKTENSGDIVADVSHSNSIQKVYIGWSSDLFLLKRGDGLVIYRTKEDEISAEYSSVATSLCIVTEVKSVGDFADVSSFVNELSPYSVFTESELVNFYHKENRNNMFVIKMLYNLALPKRPNRKKLIGNGIIDRKARASFLEINRNQLNTLLSIGEVYEGIIIN